MDTDSVELAEAKRQRDGFITRIKLMREGKMELRKIEDDGSHGNMTSLSISDSEQSLAALERKIARLEAADARPDLKARSAPPTSSATPS